MSTHISKRVEKTLLIGLDVTLLYFGYFLTAWFFHQLTSFEANYNYIFMLTTLCIITFYLFDLYSDWKRKSSSNLLFTIFLAMIVFTFSTWMFTFFFSTFGEAGVLLTASFLQFFLIVLARISLWNFSKLKYGKQNVLVVSKSSIDGQKVAEKFRHHHQGWFQVMDIITIHNKASIKKYLGQIDVVVISPEVPRNIQTSITNLCVGHGKEVMIIPEMFEFVMRDAQMQQVDDMMVFSIPSTKMNGIYQFFKRSMDIVFSISLLLLLSPILLGLYFLIPATSKGPAFFRQERIGKDGKPFYILKFRSMIENAEKITGPVLALEKDPRITPLGRRIRALRLDELPQLLNVLKGEMSLIGPRPERSYFIKQFKKEVPEYVERFTVKPGITGLAQVNAYYSTTVEDKLRYDLMYVRNCSIILDLKILLQTIRVVLQQKQAMGVTVEPEASYSGITIAKHN
ncbi:sugar transferase [Sutcliffiella deserti]|uniref:sugar transferase n=1 Tax=Sutcliffiella deserti TaxID=2875501 RepID=UPI001CBBFE7B|nr:sugar transferase [Sutcliffiella deserti]